MSKLAGGSHVRLVIDGQEMRADAWSLDVQQDVADACDMWGPRKMTMGRQHVIIELTGVHAGGMASPAPPREDIVKHLGTRCCCRHCPQGGDHA